MPKSKTPLLVYPNCFPSIQNPCCIKQHHYPTCVREIHSASTHRTTSTTCSDFRRIRARVPRRIGVDITGVLDLAHGGTAATDATAHVGAAAASVHEVDDEGGDEGGPAEPEEGAGGLSLAAVLLGVCGGVADAVGECVCLEIVRLVLWIKGDKDLRH
jgi:hypothetical protein